MTPVQLPEVPAPRAFLHNMAHNPLYTAAQLREYATEAVRQHCERVAKKIRARADQPGTAISHGNQYVFGLRNAANTLLDSAPSETNSD